MKAVYVQKRVNGLEKILLYLTGEKVNYTRHYETKPKVWLSRLVIEGALGMWNLKRVLELVDQNDLQIEYTGTRFEIFI